MREMALSRLASACEARVTVLSGSSVVTRDSDAELAEMACSGIDGLFSDDASEIELVLAIRAVASGQAMFGPRVARHILD